MKASAFVAALAIGAVAAPQALAQASLYRWVDKDGKVHYSDTPPNEDTKTLQEKRVRGGGPEDVQLPFATREAMRRNPVTYYTAPDCGDECASGRSYLSARGIPFAEKNASVPANAEIVKGLVGALVVPILIIGERPYKGFNEETWSAALDSAGYPRTRLPGQVNPLQVPEPAPAAAPAAPGAGG